MNKYSELNAYFFCALMLTIFTQEVLNVICFKILDTLSFEYFILYTVLSGIAPFIWGTFSDFFSKKHSLIFSLVLGFIPIALLPFNSFLAMLTSPLLVPAPIARAILASHRFIFFHKTLTTNTLMKLSWMGIFLAWILYPTIHPVEKIPSVIPCPLLFLSWMASFLILIFIPQEKIDSAQHEKTPFAFKSLLKDFKRFGAILGAFGCFEMVFFLMWAFSEKSHVAPNFFPLIGANCFAGTLFSFVLHKKEPHLNIIKSSYFYIVLVCFVALVSVYTFKEMDAWWAIVSFTAAASGVYLPYIYDKAIISYGKNERGRACGIIETASAAAEICASACIKGIKSAPFISTLLLLISLLGYLIHEKAKQLKLKQHA